jgi:hypothetical protein
LQSRKLPKSTFGYSVKSWMAGTSPAMTDGESKKPGIAAGLFLIV